MNQQHLLTMGILPMNKFLSPKNDEIQVRYIGVTVTFVGWAAVKLLGGLA